MNFLFIGGPLDGKRQALPRPDYYVHVPIFNPRNTSQYPVDTSLLSSVQTHTYNIQRFRDANGHTHEVYCHSSVDNAMEKLIKGYRYHRKPRRRY